MSTMRVPTARRAETDFRHKALFYAREDEFLDGATTFIQRALAADEPILVVLGAAKIERLRGELGGDAQSVQFADMAEVGRNPARIIPAWREFVSANAAPGRGLWGIGEPIWAGRTPAEVVECQRHEALLNLAFAETERFQLLCPYDTEALGPEVVHEARRSHPIVVEGGSKRPSKDYRGLEALAAPFDEPLPDPPTAAEEVAFRVSTLEAIRTLVAERAVGAGIDGERIGDVVLAVHELAANTVRHAGGEGVLRVWEEGDTLVCEVRDDGRIEQPLAGRERPEPGQLGGYGLWVVNQLCELVQLRSFPDGNVVRLHMARG
jgi:anti-sigma regulatory factor (Ser/Thr protein kinase)